MKTPPPDKQPAAETLEEIAKRIAEDPNFDARLTVADKICLRNAIWEALSNERRSKCSAPCCAQPSESLIRQGYREEKEARSKAAPKSRPRQSG